MGVQLEIRRASTLTALCFVPLGCVTNSGALPRSSPTITSPGQDTTSTSRPSEVGENANVKCAVIEAVAQSLLLLPLPKPGNGFKVVSSLSTETSYLDDQKFDKDKALLIQEFQEEVDLVDKFLRVNAVSVRLPCEGISPSVIWANRDRLRTLWDFENETWTKHLARLEPNAAGLGGFSDVAVSQDGRTAIIYGYLQYGDLGGEGKYWLVSKSKDGWKVTKRVDVWIS